MLYELKTEDREYDEVLRKIYNKWIRLEGWRSKNAEYALKLRLQLVNFPI